MLSAKAKKYIRRILKPGWFYFLRRSARPASDYAGFDRGKPLDRFYIENFLKENRADIHGHCLELLNNNYTLAYGRERVTKSDILDIERSNKNATIIGDLRNLKEVADNSYDCIILTQVFQFIDNVDAAISECHRILKTGGVLLVTLPSLSRADISSGVSGDYWRFTTASAHYLFDKKFSSENLKISSVGNVRSGIYFYAGLAEEDASTKVLEKNDPNFPLIITVRAEK